jgi:hypothetical protein
MRLISSFSVITNLSACSSNAYFPVSNVLDIEPMARWQAATYADAQWIKGQIAQGVNGLFLNQCNFPSARFQWNATDVWTSPTVDITLSLEKDDCVNRKGFFDLTGTGPGYFRIYIPSLQTLDNSEAVPAIGNIILGNAVTMPTASRYSPDKTSEVITTKAYESSPRDTIIGRSWHEITVDMKDWLSVVRALPKNWAQAVLIADMGYVDEAWLVQAPAKWPRPTESLKRVSLSVVFKEIA